MVYNGGVGGPALNESELKEIIKRKEGERLEFKSSGAGPHRLVEIVASFANTSGGLLLIGVTDEAGVRGTNIGRGTIEHLTNTITDNTDPVIYPKITIPTIDGKKIISIEVAPSDEKPHLAYGRPFKRAGSVTKLMSRSEYKRLLFSQAKYAFGSQICPEATWADIDEEAILDFKKKYESVNDSRLHGSSEEILKSRGCLTVDGRVTNAGILGFGKEPQKFIPKAYVTIVRYPEVTITDTILDSKDFFGNLFDQIDNANQYLREHIQVISKVSEADLARQDTPVYPYFVLRELLVNAVAHRDYNIYGSRVLIQMFADRIEFYSPGGFLEGITSENLRESQRSRNPAIARILNDVQYLEEFGNGIDRIYETIEDYPLKLQPPVWKDINVAVITTLFDSTYEKEEEIKEIDFSDLNKRQRRLVEYLQEHEPIKRGVYSALFKVTGRTARRDLLELIDKGVVERLGSGPSALYRLAR